MQAGKRGKYPACPREHAERRQQSILLHLPTARQAGGGRGDVVRLVDMGVDVALITVQVEIVTGIDCASKCYTTHLSFFFLYLFFS